jgi:hypothetical protein
MEALEYHYKDATSNEYTSYSRSEYEVEEVTNVWHKEPVTLLGLYVHSSSSLHQVHKASHPLMQFTQSEPPRLLHNRHANALPQRPRHSGASRQNARASGIHLD